MAVTRLSAWCALACKSPAFWQFLRVESEPAAIDKVRTLCGVKSRGEFDRDPEAAQRLNRIIRYPFIQFTHDEE